MNMINKYRHSRLALLLWAVLFFALGYALAGYRKQREPNAAQDNAVTSQQQPVARAWRV
jgi:hypothetical protein